MTFLRILHSLSYQLTNMRNYLSGFSIVDLYLESMLGTHCHITNWDLCFVFFEAETLFTAMFLRSDHLGHLFYYVLYLFHSELWHLWQKPMHHLQPCKQFTETILWLKCRQSVFFISLDCCNCSISSQVIHVVFLLTGSWRCSSCTSVSW